MKIQFKNTLVKEIFRNFELMVEEALNSNSPDKELIHFFFSFREQHRCYTGTGNNITGISELLYFLYVKKSLEKYFGEEFEIKEIENSDSYHFELNFGNLTVGLSSDVPINNKNRFGIDIGVEKPDIFICIKENEGTYIPIAVIEIKIFQKTAGLKETKERFEKMDRKIKESEYDYPLLALLYLQHLPSKSKGYDEIFQEIKSISKDNLMLMVYEIKWTKKIYEPKMKYRRIDEIIEKILEKLDQKIKTYGGY